MRFRFMILAFLLLFAAFPASSTIVNNGDGSFDFSQKSPNKFATGMCGVQWTKHDCSGSFGFGSSGSDFVTLGICTQQEADDGDALPTVLCGASQQSDNLCPSDWPVDTVLIPTKADCATYVNWAVKAWTKTHSKGGLDDLEKTRQLSKGDHSGEVTDP